jgi:hypothetical protein
LHLLRNCYEQTVRRTILGILLVSGGVLAV